jgi:putative OPT family oligopeptide transporter
MAFKPYISPSESIPEFTLRAVLAGAVFGIIFGCANAYLGLRVGLTISTSIPIAVITIAFFRAMRPVFGRTTILEHNMSQTVGSASSSLASGTIFTIPALFLWGLHPTILQIGLLGMLGALLGVLSMIPLRDFLIVKEHDTLPYPEGTACAEVMKAAEGGGQQAGHVFLGLGIAAGFKFVLSYLKLWPDQVKLSLPFVPKAQLSIEPTPALLGVGYILGFRISLIMVLGGLVSWVVLIPLLAAFGDGALARFLPATPTPLAELEPDQIWSKYIRFVGAGAVTFGGIVTVIKAIPTMYHAFVVGFGGLFKSKSKSEGERAAVRPRTELDLPMAVVLTGIVAVILVVALVPQVLGNDLPFTMRALCAVCITIFGFLFVTVSSRIVGLVGVTSNPTSGMTIVTLLGSSLVLYLLGRTDLMGKAAALTIGTMVCVAASKAGDISQDLKAGYIVGATPRRQQIGQLIGGITSAFFVASAVYMLGNTYTFGSAEIPAPQATLMKTVIEGVLSADLPWGLIAVGAALAAIAELVFRVPSLPFAVGIYLPLSTNMPVFIGGCVRRLVEKRFLQPGRSREAEESDPAKLLSAGFIAGEGLMGVVIAIIAFALSAKPKGIGVDLGSFVSLLAFALLIALLWRTASKLATSRA